MPDLGARGAQQAGALVFGQGIRHRRHRRQQGGRIGTYRHQHRERLARMRGHPVGEIQCAAENYVQYHTSIDVNMTALLKTTLRMRPDRILVGEVRGPEALDLLMAWNTGHEGGAATLHANNAKAGLDRLAMLISMHPDSPKPIEPLIGEAVHVVVHIARVEGSRRIQEILEVSGFANGQYITKTL